MTVVFKFGSQSERSDTPVLAEVKVAHLDAFEGVDDGANGVADDEDDDDEHEHHRDGVIATLV